MKQNLLITDFLDRASFQRTDKGWVQEQFYKDTAKIIPVKEQRFLCSNADVPKAVFLYVNDIKEADAAYESSVFLGIINNSSYFAVDADAVNVNSDSRSEFIDIWHVMSLMDNLECSLLVLARFMIYWNSRNRYCGKCGMQTRKSEGGNVRICADKNCGQSYFPSMDPAIIVLVSFGEKCLLGRQRKWPENMYSTLAGFVEPGESIENAVKREIMEEAGVAVTDVEYCHSQPWLFPASLMLGFSARAESDHVNVNKHEMDDAKWFTRGEIRYNLENGLMMLPGSVSISYRLIEEWFDRGGEARLANVKAKRKM